VAELAAHREKHDFHVERERHHAEHGAHHLGEVQRVERELQLLRSMVARASRMAAGVVEVEAVPAPKKTAHPKLTLAGSVAAMVRSRTLLEIFTADDLVPEVTAYLGDAVESPVTEHQVSSALRRMLAAGKELELVAPGRPHHPSSYRRLLTDWSKGGGNADPRAFAATVNTSAEE